jgi:hypothetical protein
MWFRVGLVQTTRRVTELAVEADSAGEAETVALKLAKQRSARLPWTEAAPVEITALVSYEAEPAGD